MKKVLIIPQLQSHLRSAEIISKKLNQNKVDVSYINTSNIYGFVFDKGIKIKSPSWLKSKLYQHSGIKRNILEVIYWHKNKSRILEEVKKVDVIIIFSESSFIRNVVYSSKKWEIETHLIMEGMRSENRLPISMWTALNLSELLDQVKLRMIYKLAKMFQSTIIYPYLPGLNGCTSVDYIYPLGEYSSRVIANIVAPNSQILPYGIPKYTYKSWPNLGLVEKRENSAHSILYITSAFHWHGKHKFAEYQKSDLQLLAANLDLVQNRSLFVRLHPKENVLDYEFLTRFKCFKGFRNDESLEDIALKYIKVYANISTMIAELSLLGVIVRPLLVHFNKQLLSRNFITTLNPRIIVDSESRLVESIGEEDDFILEKDKLIYHNELGFQKLINNLLK